MEPAEAESVPARILRREKAGSDRAVMIDGIPDSCYFMSRTRVLYTARSYRGRILPTRIKLKENSI